MIRRALPPCINGENFTFNVAGSRFILQRPLSTNSAIHRGIRKSNSRGRDDLSSRSWGHGSTKNVDEQRYSGRREPRFDKRDVQHTGGFGNSREDRRESWQRGNLEGEPRNPKKQWNNDRTKPGYNTFKSREDFPREQVRSPRQYTADFALSDPGNKGYSSQDQRGFSAQHEARRLRTSERIDRRDLSNGKRYAPDRCENSPSASSASISPGLPTRAERRAALYGPGDTLPGGIPRAQEEQAEYRKPLSSAPREMRDSPPHRQVNPLGDKDPDDERRHFPVRRREGSFGDGSLEDGRRPAISRASSGSDNWKPWEGKSHAPLSIPYTTPASEFLYGTSVIKAALHAQRRQMYKLYIYHGDNREIRPQEQTIRKLALARGVNVVQVQGDWLRLMDKMCMGRPHNVCRFQSLLITWGLWLI